MESVETSLAIMERADVLLAEANTIQEVEEFKTLALTAADWARRKGMGKQAEQHCRSYATRAEIKIGEMLEATERAKGAAKPGTKRKGERGPLRSTPEEQGSIPTLAELGLTRKGASQAKMLAGLSKTKRAEVIAGKVTPTQVRREKRVKEQHKRIAAYVAPPGKFEVIVVDPPWSYEKRAHDSTHRAANPYPSMTLEAIKTLEIPSDKDCILWLWTTNAFMRQAYEVLDAWGFTPKTILTWVKSKMGLGDWLRGATEHCILSVKGKPIVTLTNQTTVIHGALREHSRKPDEFFAMVESLCPAKTRREMFARQRRDGWVTDAPEDDHFPGST
jgi:N6-adenosine-specific RNA methylase IME4